MHYTYNDILKAASESSLVHEGNYRYVIVRLHRGDTSDNPASTKHSLWGPSLWLWQIHASGVQAVEYASVEEMSPNVALGAAKLDTPLAPMH